MPFVYIFDANALIDFAQAGIGQPITPDTPVPADWSRFLDDMVNGSDRAIINTIGLREAARGDHLDAGLLDDWIGRKLDAGHLEFHDLGSAALNYLGPNGGERPRDRD